MSLHDNPKIKNSALRAVKLRLHQVEKPKMITALKKSPYVRTALMLGLACGAPLMQADSARLCPL